MSIEIEQGLLGAQLVGAPPIGRVMLPLRPGLTAVYGKNGVGKSRLLAGLSRLFDPMSYRTDSYPGRYEDDSFSLAVHSFPSPASAAYLRSALHYCWPISRRIWEDPNASSPILDALDEAAEVASTGRYPGPRFGGRPSQRVGWDEVLLYVMDRLGLDASVETVEQLLEHGHWMVSCAPDAPAFLCDPRPLDGPLADQWVLAAEQWASELTPPAERFDEGDPLSEGHDIQDSGSSPLEMLSQQEGVGEYFRYRSRLPPAPSVLGLEDQPHWFALPLACIVALRGHNPVAALIQEDTTGDVDSATIRALSMTGVGLLSLAKTNDLFTAMFLRASDERMRDFQTSANKLLAGLFEEPPLLALELTHPSRWFVGEPSVKWTARNEPDGRRFGVSDLGSAHSRYVRFAIQRAIRGTRASSYLQDPINRFSVCIIDEPEAALHPSAQRYLASGLRALADFVIVATHSNEVIDMADHIVHATRSEGSSLALGQLSVDLTPDQRQFEARRLGQTPASLATLTRVVLLTEGAMDATLLSSFLEPELASCRVLLLALHGTKEVAGLASTDYLFHATDAPVVVALDNTNAKFLGGLQRRLLKANALERARLLREALQSEDVRRSSEMKKLVGLLAAANEASRLGRIAVFGFRKRDIVEYLPVSLIKPGAESWEQLWREFRTAHPDAVGPGSGRQFKAYVGAGYSVRGVAAAVDRMHVTLEAGQRPSSVRPIEFSRLAQLLVELAQRQ